MAKLVIIFDMGLFSSKEPKVHIISKENGKRIITLFDFIEDKLSAKEYAKENSHIAPNRLEFIDRVNLWEGIYIPMREKEGWVRLKGGRNDGERFKIEWQVGEDLIIATQDDWDGNITERIKKKKR